jgi:hypothetical protein
MNGSERWLMKGILWISLMLLATPLFAQSAIPPGTILPVQLNSSINSRKVKPGQVITARLMQDVPISPDSRIREGAKMIGHIEEVERSKVSVRFDILMVSKRHIPVTTNLRALASMMAVDAAQVPVTGPDRGTTENDWITERVGGESINVSLLQVKAKFGMPCRGEVAGNDRPQALWVFSSDACGAYGFSDLTIVHAGRTNPVGRITLSSTHGDVNVRAGSGLLLRVN